MGSPDLIPLLACLQAANEQTEPNQRQPHTSTAWTITLALPILSSGNSDGTGIVVSSTGRHPFSLTGTQPEFLVAWAAVLGCAASVWLLRSIKWWSVVTILVAVLLSALLITTLMNPPN